MKVFKKITSVFVVFVILISNTHLISYSLNETDALTLTEYATELIDMIQLYDNSYESGSSESNSKIRTLNRLIVKTSDNTSLENDCGAAAKIEGYDCLHIMQYNSEQAANNAFEYYSTSSSVQYVEYDFNFLNDIPDEEITEGNTSKNHLSWGSSRVNADKAIYAVESLGAFANEVVVAVLDTGLALSHEFFQDRYVDSFVNLIDGSDVTQDDNDHGSHVAGIIVDNTPSNVKIKPYKVLNYDGEGNYLMTCTGVEMAIEDGVDVINLSLGGIHSDSKYNRYREVVDLATENNIPICNITHSKNANLLVKQYCRITRRLILCDIYSPTRYVFLSSTNTNKRYENKFSFSFYALTYIFCMQQGHSGKDLLNPYPFLLLAFQALH